MRINFVEIQNFRKLYSVRVDFGEKTTVFVGANNSGKTSALQALRKFLAFKVEEFQVQDITLCYWRCVKEIGKSWHKGRSNGEQALLELDVWRSFLPVLDLWLDANDDELHHVRDLIPTLSWSGGTLGVRLAIEPKNLEDLYARYLEAMDSATHLRGTDSESDVNSLSDPSPQPPIWPLDLLDFLRRKFASFFTVRAYVLDPKKIQAPNHSCARPQVLRNESQSLEGNPLAGIIKVHHIDAQRGFGDVQHGRGDRRPTSRGRRLSAQLQSYYTEHLDPTEHQHLDPTDLEALRAIKTAEESFNQRLEESFRVAFDQVESMGYPGISDPKPHVSTQLNFIDGLNHAAAVSFRVANREGQSEQGADFLLPEDYNGLGYQNLISMIFDLMSFRDTWLKVGKGNEKSTVEEIEPIHLVLAEEPEAHLHAQVQQVFIKKAYQTLSGREELGPATPLHTQLVISTHSSHLAHEAVFATLRYFRRIPAGMVASVPVSTVANLSTVFGTQDETDQFVTRYLRSQHVDLFFADAAILIEGAAERILLPNFIERRSDFLNQRYLSILEIGGSHAHRLRELLLLLGLPTLIVTDLDAINSLNRKAEAPSRDSEQITANQTLKTWIPNEERIDALLDAGDGTKVLRGDDLCEVRVAYQMPVELANHEGGDFCPSTFEDALAMENVEFFKKQSGAGLVGKLRDLFTTEALPASIAEKLFEEVRNGRKAEFALDIIASPDFLELNVPTYIKEGLDWLETRLQQNQEEVLFKSVEEGEDAT